MQWKSMGAAEPQTGIPALTPMCGGTLRTSLSEAVYGRHYSPRLSCGEDNMNYDVCEVASIQPGTQ